MMLNRPLNIGSLAKLLGWIGTPDKSLKYGLIEPWIGKRNNNRMEMDPPTYHTVHWNDCGDGSLSGLIYLLVGGGPKWLRANCLDSDDNGGSSSSSPPLFPPPPKSLLICQLKQQSCLHLCPPLPIVVHWALISSNMSIPTTSKGDSPWPNLSPLGLGGRIPRPDWQL